MRGLVLDTPPSECSGGGFFECASEHQQKYPKGFSHGRCAIRQIIPIRHTMKTIFSALAAIALVSTSCTKSEESTEAKSASESSTKPYPLDTCLVSGEKIGSMGDPIIINHEGREIKFCCDSCVPKFKKDPAKYLAKLDHSNHSH